MQHLGDGLPEGAELDPINPSTKCSAILAYVNTRTPPAMGAFMGLAAAGRVLYFVAGTRVQFPPPPLLML